MSVGIYRCSAGFINVPGVNVAWDLYTCMSVGIYINVAWGL